MRAKIDIVFLDAQSIVLAIEENAGPWRYFMGPRGTDSVLELPAGHAGNLGLAPGHFVSLRSA